jgi:hydrogenase-4 component E
MIHNNILVFLSGTLLIATVVLVVKRDFSGWIQAYRYQTIILTIITGVIGYVTNNWEIYIAAIITFSLKAVIVPRLLTKVTEKISYDFKNEAKPYLSIRMSLVLSTILVALSYFLTQQIKLGEDVIATSFLPVSISLLLIGLLIMVGRKIALNQIVGLLILENGLFLFVLSLTHGISLVIEIGIFIDILVGIVISSILIHRIGYTFDNIDDINQKRETLEYTEEED